MRTRRGRTPDQTRDDFGSEWVRARTARAGKLVLAPIDLAATQLLIQCTLVFDHVLDAGVLREGLSRLLDHYPFLGGRIDHRKAIAYEDGGIPFSTRTEKDASIADFGPSRTNVDAYADRRRSRRIKRGRDPLMTVRLTKLRDGCLLAVCCSHACFDGTAFFAMIRDWSRAALGQPIETPVFERPAPPSERRSKSEVANSARRAGWHHLTLLDGLRYLRSKGPSRDRVFVGRFSDEALRRCRRACRREMEGERVSTNTALVAHVTKCLTSLLDFEADARWTVSVVADTRGRMAGRPVDYAGNASVIITTDPMPVTAAHGAIAAQVQRQLRRTLDRSSGTLASDAALIAEVIRHRLRYSPFPAGEVLRRRPSHIYTNSFAKYPIYDLDFCGSKPVRVVPHNLGDPVLLWPAPPDVGGVELYVGGPLAKAVRALEESDPWWAQLRRFEVGTAASEPRQRAVRS